MIARLSTLAPSIRATIWMTGAVASFSAMAVAGRVALADHDTFEILLFRSIVGVVIVLAVSSLIGTRHQITTRHLGTQFIRNAFHFAGQNLWFFALTLIPLAQVFALEFTSPIWATFMAALILGERITLPRMVAAVLGFAGIWIIARPDFDALNIGVLAAAASAIGFAGTAVFTRKLTRTESATCILFWLTVMQMGMGLVFAGADGAIRLPDAQVMPWMVVIAITGLTAHFCVTNALSIAPAGIVMTMDFARLPVIAIIGMAFYGEPLDNLVIVGAAIILCANWLNIRNTPK